MGWVIEVLFIQLFCKVILDCWRLTVTWCIKYCNDACTSLPSFTGNRNNIDIFLYNWRALCAGDVLQLAACNQTADEWRYYTSGQFKGLALGSNNEFMACWITGTDWQGPYNANGEPLRQKPFEEVPADIGCSWSKLPAWIQSFHSGNKSSEMHHTFTRNKCCYLLKNVCGF